MENHFSPPYFDDKTFSSLTRTSDPYDEESIYIHQRTHHQRHRHQSIHRRSDQRLRHFPITSSSVLITLTVISTILLLFLSTSVTGNPLRQSSSSASAISSSADTGNDVVLIMKRGQTSEEEMDLINDGAC